MVQYLYRENLNRQCLDFHGGDEDVQFVFLQNDSPNQVNYKFSGGKDRVILHFQTRGSARTIFTTEVVDSLPDSHQFYFAEQGRILLSAKASLCIILIHKQILNKYYSGNCPFLSRHSLPVTPCMLSCLTELKESGRTGVLLKLHAESVVIKLLMLHMEQTENHNCNVFCSLQETEVSKIYKARDLITENLDHWFTIAELSARVGTNECSFKRGFKEVFGKPVFEFITTYKMVQAEKLLKSGVLTVSDVSEQLGYKNLTHFSAAFKRRYKVSPSRLKAMI
jgi:AraC-like DNA-binding protein